MSVSVISISLCISQLFSLWILWCLELKISDPFRSCMQKFCTPFSFMHVGVRNLYFVYLDHWRYTELTSQGNVKIDPLINEKQMSKNMRGVRERERERPMILSVTCRSSALLSFMHVEWRILIVYFDHRRYTELTSQWTDCPTLVGVIVYYNLVIFQSLIDSLRCYQITSKIPVLCNG